MSMHHSSSSSTKLTRTKEGFYRTSVRWVKLSMPLFDMTAAERVKKALVYEDFSESRTIYRPHFGWLPKTSTTHEIELKL